MLDGIDVSNLTAPTLVGIAVLSVILGVLVPKYIYKDVIRERDNWRNAYEAEREARVTSDAQTRELLELAKTTHSIVVALFGTAPERSRFSGGQDVVSTQTSK